MTKQTKKSKKQIVKKEKPKYWVELTPKIMQDYYTTLTLPTSSFKLAYARQHPSTFSKYLLNTTPYPYQHHFFNQIMKYDKLIIVKGRQLGFSTSLGLFAIWAAFFNKYPSGVSHNTKIAFISKEDDAAKKLLLNVRELLYKGDVHMSALLKGRKEWTQQFFNNRLSEPNNTEQITFKNGSWIKSFPPTAKVRGQSFDLVFVDEAAFLRTENPRDFFYKVIVPTTAKTNGKIIALSTPNGEGNYFYDLADPENIQEYHPYKRFYYHYSISKDVKYLNFVQQQQQIMDIGSWNQEYTCDFVSSTNRFFIPAKVNEAVDPVINQTDYSLGESIVGIDFGMTQSRTVISLSTMIEDKIIIHYIDRFESGEDVNKVIPKVTELMRKYHITTVVADDCPQGNAIINQMISKGWNVKPFNFTREKYSHYVAFRSRLNSGLIKVLKHDGLIKEMLELRQEETKQAKLSIHKPTGGTDDVIDSIIMSSSVWLDTTEQFKVRVF